MSPYIGDNDETANIFTPLTIDMELSEPACPITDVEEMIIEQRGSREVIFFKKKFINKNFNYNFNLGSFYWNG